MNKELWRMYGVRTGKICAHLCIALAVVLLTGLIAMVALPLIAVIKIMVGIVLVIISLGLLLLREGFAETMFTSAGLDAMQSFLDGYAAALPALAGAAMACSAAAIVLLACCERKGERSVVRMSFACVVFVFALAVLALRQAGG